MLQINDLTFRHSGKLIFENASASIASGHKVGLVGRNGAGKSTLLGLIAGDLHADQGDISIPLKAKMGRVAQEAPDGPASLVDTVLSADLELASLQQRLEREEDPNKLAEIHERLNDINAHSAPARAAALLSGLGFNAEAQKRPVGEFSGGWRMRVALASVLFTQPDLLLLDEPTNYLDLEGAIWLENYLKSYPYSLIMVSHDRDMLNAVCDTILHVEQGKLHIYRGNYDRFERTRAEKLELQSKMQAKQNAQRKHLQSFVDRFRYKASKAKQAQSRIKMLERLEPAAALSEDASISLQFPTPEYLPPPLITLDDVSVGYGADVILRHLNLRIDMEDRVALLGPNGAGKSTMAKLLSGRLKPMEGQYQKPKKLKVGYFAQHQLDELHPDQSAFEHMSVLMPLAGEAKTRARLGQFGFSADKADRPVETLSGGEKARLLFCLITYDKPHLLILDEPTNHLDLDARQALVQALNGYEGAVLLISHDRFLIETCVDDLYVIEEGTVNGFKGDLDDYAKKIVSERRSENNDKPAKSTPAPSAKEQRRLAAEKRKKLQPYKKAIDTLEKDLEKLSKQKSEIDEALAEPDLYDGSDKNISRLTRLQLEQKKLEDKIADIEAQWLQAQEDLEYAETMLD